MGAARTDALPIPASAADVDVAWLRGALSTHGFDPAALRGCRPADVGTGRGFTAQVLRLKLDWAEPGAGPASLVVKLAAASREAAELARGGYEREYVFYRRFAERTPLPTPRCFHAAYDEDGARFVLLLEDLVGLEGGDQLAGTSEARAEVAVRGLAALHARFWNDAEVRERVASLQDEFDFVEARELYRAGLDELKATRAEQLPMVILMAETVWEYLSAPGFDGSPEPLRDPFTLLHGDYRLDNMFFGAEQSPLVVIDWVVRAGPPATDLGYFLFGSLTTEQLRARGPALRALYHRTLVEHGIDDYGPRRIRRDCQRALATMAGNAVLAQVMLDRKRKAARGDLAQAAPAAGSLEARLQAFFAGFIDDERGEPLFEAMVGRVEGALQRGRMTATVLRTMRGFKRVQNGVRRLTRAE